jgi:two-component system sensor histidine kinase KdpD
LINLLSNAAVHTPDGTPVCLRVWQDGESLFIQVADRGAGIAAHSLPRVFDKFFRGPAAPTGGTGLGLSLVKGFVEALGGKVKAENRNEGGAAFTIILPLTHAIVRASVSI